MAKIMFFMRVIEKFQMKEKIMSSIKNIPWTALIFSVLAIGLLLIIGKYGFGIDAVPEEQKDTPEIVLPILVMVGAVCLLASLAFVAGGFAALGLSDRRQALGLPEGSVRALIALLLLSLFVITAIHLYNRLRIPLENSIVTQYSGISETQLGKIPSDQIISIRVRTEGDAQAQEKVFDVDRRLPAVQTSEESKRFAQQILTAVSTLVIAVAGFYFGTRSVTVARGGTAPSIPSIDTVNPPKRNQGDTENIEILGKNFESPKTVKFVAAGADDMELEVLTWTATRILCKLEIPQSQPKNKYGIILVNADGGWILKRGVFTVE